MLSDLAFGLVGRGREVVVITSRQRYDDPAANLGSRESVKGVTVYRIWTTRFGRGWLPGRALDYLTFYVSCIWRLWWTVGPGDVVVAKTDPPMLSIIAQPIARLRDGKVINWLQDLFPEVARALGIRLLQGRIGKALSSIRNRSLRKSDLNVVIGQRMMEALVDNNIDSRCARVIPNWADGKAIVPTAAMENPLRKAWELADQFVIGYSGNMGRSHPFDAILQAIALTRDTPVVWLFIGDGPRKGWLESEVASRGLSGQVMFKRYQPRDILAHSLGVPDAHLVTLEPALEGMIVPSKYYGVLAAGRPTLFIGDVDGEVARDVQAHQTGMVIGADDGEALATKVRSLMNDRGGVEAMGDRARKHFEREYTLKSATDRWCRVIDELARLEH